MTPRLFPPAEAPRVFALPPGADFCRALVDGLDSRLADQPPEAAARVEVWVNTRRARRALVEEFSARGPRLLPRIRVVTDLADDPLGPADLPPPTPALRQRLELARLVAGLGAAASSLTAGTSAFDLADSLADLLDEMQGECLDRAEFARLDVAEHAVHWQASLAFLGLIGGYLAAAGPAEGEGRLRAAAEATAAMKTRIGPREPVEPATITG